MLNARRADRGFTLVEMMVVIGLLGTVIGVIFGAVQVLSTSASTSMEESASAHDLSYSMEVLSKALMSGRVVYADDYQVTIVTTMAIGHQAQSIYSTATPDATRGGLVWVRWSSDKDGTIVPGTVPTFHGVMSDRNMNCINPKVPLFAYYTGATDDTTASVSAGGYALTPPIKRIRLTVAAAFGSDVRKDSRDVFVR